MINRTEFITCNDHFFNNLENSKRENTVDTLISEWNKCSSKEIIEKLSKVEKFNKPEDWETLCENDSIKSLKHLESFIDPSLFSTMNATETNIKKVMQTIIQCKTNKNLKLVDELPRKI